jgi:hypothetical protein
MISRAQPSQKLKEAAFLDRLFASRMLHWQAYMMPSPPLTKVPGVQPMPLRCA